MGEDVMEHTPETKEQREARQKIHEELMAKEEARHASEMKILDNDWEIAVELSLKSQKANNEVKG